MAGRLKDKIALVTGIGAGIGRGIALRFAREGATVIGCDIDATTAAATVQAAADEGLQIASVHPCDLTRPADVERYVRSASDTHGRIDILVNAAAIPPHMARAAEMDYEGQWTPTMAGEVDIVFLAVKAAWPWLLKSGKASIINFASVSAFRGSTNFGMLAHCAGKAAVLGMTRQLAIEGGPGIRANTISPGLVVTPATASAGGTDGAIRERLLERMPLKRLGDPDDIAWCAVFLASDEASWITGANFPVDGGVMAG
ncbi:MAG: SDR family oxidoreductase [Burkholderiales bacterium]|nr:SDR family oxidoreductase [Burkholderiales bacterium]